jgi:hypothetical protein
MIRIALVAAALTLAGFVTPAAADYKAIAFSNVNGGYGYAYGHSTRRSAEIAALGFCRPNGGRSCRIVAWTNLSCIALATGRRYGYGVAWGNSSGAVRSRAVAECRARDRGCALTTVTCN